MKILIYISIGAVILYIIYKFVLVFEKSKSIPFYLRQNVMNGSEQALFINLNKYLGDEYIILSKVRTEDFIGVKKMGLSHNKIFGFRNKIKSRHVDFLICDLITTKPLLVIELDGGSHNNYYIKNRDNNLDKIYTNINLKHLHIKVGNDFEKEAEEIKNLLKI